MARESRKDSILQAALMCFTKHGVEGTTIEMIREVSGASIGSLYHHFGNRERIIGALYLEGIKRYGQQLNEALASQSGTEHRLRAVVHGYLGWIADNPDWARFLFSSRGQVEAGPLADELTSANASHLSRMAALGEALEQRGDIRAIPAQCLPALITGPAQEVARNWLAGRLTGDLREYAEPLAEAAWRSVRADRIRTNDGG
ncbi:MAG: TetR/AcrR family transcriptional regulator [Pseudomonadaceae bacterium]